MRPQPHGAGAGASPEEAAAAIAAVERFLRDSAPPAPVVAAPPSRWLATARSEAVEREPRALDRW